MTPRATDRELYASSDLPVAGPPPLPSPASAFSSQAESGVYHFELKPAPVPAYAHQTIDLTLKISRADGGAVLLLPFQDTFAQMELFDDARSGFLALSSLAAGRKSPPDAFRPAFNFTVSIPDPGRYIAWTRVNIAGKDTAIPFSIDVLP
jgi:hypothetical protein